MSVGAWPRADAPDTRMLTLGPHRVRVQVRGAGRPLLLLGGLGANVEMWAPFQRALRGFRLVAFDPPGCGASPPPERALDIPAHADLAAAVLDAVGHAGQAVDVLGLSFGGMVAQQLVHDAPERVRRLVLVSTGVGWGSVPGTPFAYAVLASPQRYYSGEFFARTAPYFLGGAGSVDPRFLAAQVRARRAHPPDPLAYLQQLWAGSTWSSLSWLHQVRQPTLSIGGEEDPLVPAANAALIARLLPDARCHVVPGGGHLCLLDSADRVAPLIGDFLRG